VGSTELRSELVSATEDVGRVGRPVLDTGTPRWERDDRSDRPPERHRQLPLRTMLGAALLIAAAICGAIVATLVGGSSSERTAQSAAGQTAHAAVSATTKAPAPATATAAATAAATAGARAATATAQQRSTTTTARRTTTSQQARTESSGRLAPAVSQAAPRAATTTTTTTTISSKRPLPSSGYASGGTHLLVDRSGQMIVNFVVAQGCVRGALLPTIQILDNGTFHYKGLVRATPVTRGTISGRFVDRTHVRVSMRFVSPRCESAKALTLRLS
jgi:hypothetical protein